MLRIKKLATGVLALASAGVAGFVLAQQPSDVGSSAPTTNSAAMQFSTQSHEGGQLGLDGRPIGSRKAPPETMIKRTYYVGDLLGIQPAESSTAASS